MTPPGLAQLGIGPGSISEWPTPTGVDAQGKYLLFRFEAGPYVGVRPRTDADILRRFIAIRREADTDLLVFAREFGPLGLCRKHRHPMTHKGSWKNLCPDDRTMGGTHNLIRERKGAWFYYIEAMRSVLIVATKLRGERPVVPEDFQTWLYPVDESAFRWPWDSVRGALNSLLAACIFQFAALPGTSLPSRVDLVGIPPLFAALALQLAAQVHGRDLNVFCSNCGNWYAAKRKPNPSRRRFCPACREKGIPAVLANRDRRSRAKKERQERKSE